MFFIVVFATQCSLGTSYSVAIRLKLFNVSQRCQPPYPFLPKAHSHLRIGHKLPKMASFKTLSHQRIYNPSVMALSGSRCYHLSLSFPKHTYTPSMTTPYFGLVAKAAKLQLLIFACWLYFGNKVAFSAPALKTTAHSYK